MSDGHKKDAGKTRYDLVPPEGEELVARVFTFGAGKYGDREWENGKVAADRWYAAVRRHLNAVRDGEYLDPESGLPHLAHAATGTLMWLTLAERERADWPTPTQEEVREVVTGYREIGTAAEERFKNTGRDEELRGAIMMTKDTPGFEPKAHQWGVFCSTFGCRPATRLDLADDLTPLYEGAERPHPEQTHGTS